MIVVMGSGIAGLSAALSLAMAKYEVVVVTKSVAGGSTPIAKGGIAAAIGRDDSPEVHFQDTVKTGKGLCDETSVRYFTHLGVKAVQTLMDLGFRFDMELWLEGGHSRRRVLHKTDETGGEIHKFLYHKVLEYNVRIVEATLLGIKVSQGRAKGVVTDKGEIEAEKVVIATGGYNYVFKYSTSFGNVGEGIARAFEAGALVADMEMVQFHPTVTEDGFLMTETLRGEGAMLVNDKGERFAFKYDERGELAPRDVLARAIYLEYMRGNQVFLDLSPVKNLKERFPVVYRYLATHGLKDRVKVVPAAHFTIGGILTNFKGQSSVENLFAVGEAADTGFHGANRLASNSLLEGLVMGLNLAEFVEDDWSGPKLRNDVVVEVTLRERNSVSLEEVREGNWRHLGIVRNGAELMEWLKELEGRTAQPWGLVSFLATYGALIRCESRGVHYREDCPEEREELRRRIAFQLVN